MSTLHWLLINLAVVVNGTPITRYATFKNLDLTSSCHVGVLAKDKTGTTWVIQNNDNGTYSMTWEEYVRKWGTHKINISEWMDSVDGTTIEGAVGVGNLNCDALLDKCYEVRDAVVGYLSGSNGSLSILTAQTCPAKKRYCGHDPEAKAMEVDIHRQRQKLLISCGDDGRIAEVGFCDHNCINPDNAGHARCQCSPHKHYCGHELTALGGWIGYDSHILNLCLDGINVSIIENCSNECVATGNNSICYGYCTPNNSYCGHELLEMGLKGYYPNTVYQCQLNGRLANSTQSCPDACVQMSGKAFCPCHPGRLYCAHELITQLNWWWISDDEQVIDHPHKLGQCQPDKITWNFSCSNCIASYGKKDAYCQWTQGVFCGRKLNAMGWLGYENNTLYGCGEEERNVTVISICLNDTCQGNTCNCIPNRTYCGHQLKWMGWSGAALEKSDSLMQCKEDGAHVDVTRCKKCTNSGGQARCAVCKESEQYCGHELLSEANGIYNCNNQGNISLIKTCNRSCARVSNGNNLIPRCLGECIPGDTYCGSKLLALGYTGYNDTSIYSCSTDGQNLTTVNTCSSGCTITSEKPSICSEICSPNRSYCGWKLREMGLNGYDSNSVHRCDASGQSAISIANCSEECVEGGDEEAFCQCHPGRLYCAHELIPQLNWWWISNDEYAIDNPHKLGQCQPDKQRITLSINCINCIASQGEKDAYCQWTPGVYCGRKLNAIGWPGGSVA